MIGLVEGASPAQPSDAEGATSSLSSILVADLSRVLAGPLIGMTLGDLGAEVIKVEHPRGDDTRSWVPPTDASGRGTYHHAANRNKRSIALDFDHPGDQRLVRRLCERSDVVISNFKPGTLERHGIGYEQVQAVNPGVIYCEVSGFGEGSGRDLPGYDPLVQALGGMMSITGPPGHPSKTGVALIDVVAGLYATAAVLAALRERDRSRLGQRITLNLFHVTLAALCNQATAWLGSETAPSSTGNAHSSIEPFGPFRTADRDLMICAGNDSQFARLARVLDAPGLAQDPDFSTNAARVAARARLRIELEQRLSAATCAEWWERLRAVGVPAGPVQSIPEAFRFAESLGLDVVDDTDGVCTVALPVRFSRTPAKTRYRPPDLDEHGESLRRWLQS